MQQDTLLVADNQGDSPNVSSLRSVFVGHILSHFSEWCREAKTEPSPELFIHFMFHHDLFSKKGIKHYSIPRQINHLIVSEKAQNRTEAVAMVADQFGLAESTVWAFWKEGKTQLTEGRKKE